MGYYTKFELSYKLPEGYNDENRKFIAELKDKGIEIPKSLRTASYHCDLEVGLEKVLIDDSFCCASPLMGLIDSYGEKFVWYEHQKDMNKLSVKFPEILFTLKGEGEESGDLWVEYYKGGKMQRCDAEITFAAFNEEKLQ